MPSPAALPRACVGRRVLLSYAVVVGALLYGAAPVWSSTVHTFSSSFGSGGSLAGEMSSPSGIAVSAATGDVYVADAGNARIDEFSSSGTFVRAWGWGVADGMPKLETCTLSCGPGLSGSGAGELEAPAYVAVDNSAGASAGDVYVGDKADNLVTKFTATGGLEKSWGDSSLNGPAPQGQLDGSSGSGAFTAIAGIAVDSAGVLDVLDASSHAISQFEQDGAFVASFETPRETLQAGLAVDGAGELFKVNGNGSVEELNNAGGDIGQIAPNEEEGGSARGLAASGSDLYVVEAGVVQHYALVEPGVVSEPGGTTTCTVGPDAPCHASDSFGAGHLTAGAGVATDPATGVVYAADATTDEVNVFEPIVVPDVGTDAATEIKPTSATLNGVVNPEGVEVTDCHFDYGTSGSYGQVVPCVETVGSGNGEVTVHADVTGLEPGLTYHFRLQAENASKTPVYGQDVTFTTQPRPVITAETASDVAADSALLEAQVNPGGLATVYQFEYGTTVSYGTSLPVPSGAIGSGTTPVSVSAEATSLTANTTYHWRVVASNGAGVTTGPDHTFVYAENAPGLPDNRAYEMVTPLHKNAALIANVPFAGPQPDISEDGSRMIIGTLQCFAGAESCPPVRGGTVGTPYLFRRTASGWTTTPLAPSAADFETNSWWTYNVEAETALFSMPTAPHGEDDFYARGPGGAFIDIGPLSPPSVGPSLQAAQETHPVFASTDLSHVIFHPSEAVWPFSTQEPGEGSLLEYVGAGQSEPMLVGVSGGLGSKEQISACGVTLGAHAPGPAGEVSADGRVVYFTAMAESPHNGTPCPSGTGVKNGGIPVATNELFARVDGGEADAHTVAISEPQARELSAPEEQPNCLSTECQESTSAANEGAWREASFAGVSADGSQAYFTSGQQLTDAASEDNDPADLAEPCRAMVSTGCNLYVYDLGAPEGHRLLDASAAEGGAQVTGGPRVQGVLAFSSNAEYGAHVYFVAKGVLTTVANAEGKVAQDGVDNLYMFERDTQFPTGHVVFIADLASADFEEWLQPAGTPANVTPDGRFLVFTSHGQLTPDVTRSDGAVQVFRYDAESGQLQRLSIGEQGFDDNGNGGAGDATIVPGYKGYYRAGAARPDPTMANNGSRVFFMSPVALTTKALASIKIGTIGESGEPGYAENVYEWEQEGVGSCPVGRSEGCVSLISDGRDTGVAPPESACSPSISAVCLIGVDGSGANVFFSTADQLVSQDTDTQLDIYDARICEPEAGNPCISAPASALPPCLGEVCHGTPPAPWSPTTPGSATFNGSGNLVPVVPAKAAPKPTRAQLLAKALKACRVKRDRHKRVSCEAGARRKYGAVKKPSKKKGK